jgi:hypothetical protein
VLPAPSRTAIHTIAHTMRQKTAALRDFDPANVCFGSFASKMIG